MMDLIPFFDAKSSFSGAILCIVICREQKIAGWTSVTIKNPKTGTPKLLLEVSCIISSFSIEESSFSMEESLKNLHFHI